MILNFQIWANLLCLIVSKKVFLFFLFLLFLLILKNVFLKILQHSQENPCARASFLIMLRLKKRPWHRCFPVNIVKLLLTPVFIEQLRLLPVVKLEPSP